MKQFYSICCALAVSILCSCSTDIPEESQVGSIAGSVSDRTTGEPVATVNVSINPGGSSTVTGSDGTFLFRNLEDGKYTLTITKTGYKQNNSTVSVRAGEPTLAHLLIERIPAVVTADRELLDFGANESTNTLSFNIINPGYIDLEWEIEERCDWITEVKPAKGTLKYGKTEAIIVVIDRKVLPSGPNEAVIVVRSSNGSSDVKVTAIGAERYVPQLNTLAASGITSSSATLNGELTNAGVPAYTERGFVYSLNSMPTFDNMLAKLTAPVTEDAKYSYVVKGLTLGDTYYVRAYAINSIGTAYSTNEINFTTAASSPELTVQNVTDMNVSKTSATFNGTVVNAGDPAYFERGFVYSTNSNPTINNIKIKANGTGTGSFSVNVSDLKLNQRYYVRTYAICKINDSEQEVYSKEEVSFTISTTAPQISVQDVSNINVTAATATFNGTVVNAGDPIYIERGFVYGTTSNPTTDDTKVKANGTGTGTFSANISELQLNQRYYVRAYATSKIGENEQIAYSSEQVNFTLASTAPAVTVQEVTNLNVSAGTATFNGTVTNTGTPTYTELGFVYGTVSNPTVDDTKIKTSGTGIGKFSANISGLKLNQQYFVRAYAIHKVGETEYQTYSAEQATFTLTPTAPAVSVDAVTNMNVTACSVTLNGSIINIGMPAYTERGFVYGSTRNPTISDTKVIASGSGTGAFSINVSNLDLNKTYYVRAYVIGSTGIVYSQADINFVLTSTSPELTMQNISNLSVEKKSVTLNATVKNVGNPPYRERGFVYSTTTNPTLNDTYISVNGTGAGSFSTVIHDLKLGQTYYVRAYANCTLGNDTQTVYSSNQTSFTYKSTLPIVTMDAANPESYTSGSVILTGTISSIGDPIYTEKGFVYSLNNNPLISDHKLIVEGNNSGPFTTIATGLLPNQQYYVRAYAINEGGVAYSDNKYFTIRETIPYIHNLSQSVNKALKIATLTATISGLADPPIKELGFVYSNMSSEPTLSDSKIKIENQTNGEIYTTIHIDIDTKYYWRVYIVTNAGITYSSSNSFSTSTKYPTITTLAASNEDTTNGSVILNGNIQNVGDPAYTEKGFVYSSSNTLPTINDSKIVIDGIANGKYSYSLSGLQPNIFYYVRAYAINVKGITYGTVIRILGPEYYTYPSIKLSVQKTDGNLLTYAAATLSCKNSRLGGYSDWRLPTIDECSKIYSQINSFDNYSSLWMWTSTYAGEENYGLSNVKVKLNYIYSFSNGSNNKMSISPNYEDSASYRCVRTIN